MLVEAFLNYLRLERNYSDKTVVAYESDLRQFEDYFRNLDENLDFTWIDACVVRSWVVNLMDEKKTKPSSVNRKLSSLRSFYRFLLKRGKVTVNPLSKVVAPKKERSLPSFLREGEMERLLDEIPWNGDFEGCRDRLILEMFYVTGMRLSELIGLDDADVDFLSRLIKVTGKRNKQRLIPFADELASDMLEYIKIRHEARPKRINSFFVLKNGERMYSGKVYKIVRRNLSKVVTLKKRSPHVLRHTFATTMLNNQAELEAVKELLGHQSLAATEVYTHTTFEELKKVYEQAHPRA